MKKIFALTFAAAMACAASAMADCATGEHGAISIQNIDGVCTAVIYGDKSAAGSTGDSTRYLSLGSVQTTVDSVFYFRKDSETKSSQTVVFPFEVSKSCSVKGSLFYDFDYLKKSNNVYEVVLAQAKDKGIDISANGLKANNPYIIRFTEGWDVKKDTLYTSIGGCKININTTATPVTNVYSATNLFKGTWNFKGVFAKKTWGEEDDEWKRSYGFSAHKFTSGDVTYGIGKFVKATQNSSVPPMRAYLVYDPNGVAPALTKTKTLASAEDLNVLESVENIDDMVVLFADEVAPAAETPAATCFEEGDGIIALKNVDGKQTFCIDGASDARLQNVLDMNIPNGTTVNNVVFNRTFPVGEGWGKIASTIVFPFDIRYGCVEGAQFFQIAHIKTYVDGNGANVWQVSASELRNGTKANTPYFVYAQKEKMTFLPEQWGQPCDYVYSVSDKIIDTTFSATYQESGSSQGFPGTWTFKGTYERLIFDATTKKNVYGFSSKQTESAYPGMFVKAGVGASVPPMRGYLKYDYNGVVGAKAASGVIASISEESLPDSIFVEFLDEDGNPMSIGSMNTLTGEIKMDENAWFDMKGRKMNHKPTVKGTYYNKGQKVIIK